MCGIRGWKIKTQNTVSRQAANLRVVLVVGGHLFRQRVRSLPPRATAEAHLVRFYNNWRTLFVFRARCPFDGQWRFPFRSVRIDTRSDTTGTSSGPPLLCPPPATRPVTTSARCITAGRGDGDELWPGRALTSQQ